MFMFFLYELPGVGSIGAPNGLGAIVGSFAIRPTDRELMARASRQPANPDAGDFSKEFALPAE
jgi:hypothetical protein